MFAYDVTFTPTVAICVNVTPLVERSMLKPVSLDELSAQGRVILFGCTLPDRSLTLRSICMPLRLPLREKTTTRLR